MVVDHAENEQVLSEISILACSCYINQGKPLLVRETLALE